MKTKTLHLETAGFVSTPLKSSWLLKKKKNDSTSEVIFLNLCDIAYLGALANTEPPSSIFTGDLRLFIRNLSP